MAFNENLVGKRILYSGKKAIVYEYLTKSREHIIHTLQGDRLKVNLNFPPHRKRASLHIPGSECVLRHISSGFLPLSPMPKGKGNEHQLSSLSLSLRISVASLSVT